HLHGHRRRRLPGGVAPTGVDRLDGGGVPVPHRDPGVAGADHRPPARLTGPTPVSGRRPSIGLPRPASPGRPRPPGEWAARPTRGPCGHSTSTPLAGYAASLTYAAGMYASEGVVLGRCTK